MAFKGGFALRLGVRLLLLAAALTGTAAAAVAPGMHAATLVLLGLAVATAAALWHQLTFTNRSLARFVGALRHDDLGQRFSATPGAAGFDTLGRAMDEAIDHFRVRRGEDSGRAAFSAALVEDAPVALFELAGQGRATPLNKAARRLVGPDPVRPAWGAQLGRAEPGAPVPVMLELDGTPHRATGTVALVAGQGAGAMRVAALQPIQAELDRAEMEASRNLVRVLTHEVMNSLTPITSLARSAADIMAELEQRSPELDEARAAVAAVARRAEGMARFVETYRQISRSPPLRRQPVLVGPFLGECARIARAAPERSGVTVALSVEPERLLAEVDPDLLAQAMINLVGNAIEAAAGHAPDPRVEIGARAGTGGWTLIDVCDNGPGIPPQHAEDVFLPFFTTKSAGTGVGLALARQVVLAHGGKLSHAPGPAGGTCFRIRI